MIVISDIIYRAETYANEAGLDFEQRKIFMSGAGWVLSDIENNMESTFGALLAENNRLRHELAHLVRLLEPLEQSGELQIPGLATLNGARAALNEQK